MAAAAAALVWAEALVQARADAAPAATGPDASEEDAARGEALADGAATLVQVSFEVPPLALAWALKDICYGAWSSQPQRSALAADVLCDVARTLALRSSPLDDAESAEIDALADWTQGIAALTQGRMADAAAALDAAADRFGQLHQQHHAVQTQVPKIMALAMLGQHAAAVDCAQRTQLALLAMKDSLGAAKVSLNLAGLHVRHGDFAAAVVPAREAAVLFARAGKHEHSVMADINLAAALTSLGELDEGARIYARAAMRAQHHTLPVLQALAAESIALLDLVRGRYRDALAGFERARQGYEALAMPQHLAIAEKQLADAYLEVRLLPEALALLDQSLLKFEALNMPDDQAAALVQRGRALAMQGQSKTAALALAAAAEVFAAQGSAAGSAAVALARAELALAVPGGGQSSSASAAEAEALATQAAARFAEAGLVEGGWRADVVRAHAMLATARTQAARDLFAATLARVHELQLVSLEVQCLTGLGLAALALDEPEPAARAFNLSIELFEAQRQALPGDDVRAAFLTDHLRPYQELLRLALRRHSEARSGAHNEDTAAQVLVQLDRFRARVLGERLMQGAHSPDGLDPGSHGGDDEAVAMRSLRERLNWLYRRVQREQQEGETAQSWVDEMRRAERDLLEMARRQRLADATAPGSAANADEGIDVAALVASLSPGDALVEYGVIDDELFACVVTSRGACVQRHLASWQEVLTAIRAARFQVETLRHGALPVQRHLALLTVRMQLSMQRLHALVWAPLAARLVACTRVVVVPHAQLGALPFAALHDGKQPLALDLQLAVAPSARLAHLGLMQALTTPRSLLAIGDSSHLEHAASEARAVAALFSPGMACVDAQATMQSLREQASRFDVIHLACHAQFRDDNPMFSALHLADAALTVELAQQLKLRAALVVLSACETGRAELGSGDEAQGLVRAFMVAGASRVLAALWPVDDAVTLAFMTVFYGALAAGSAPAAALRAAQISVMREHSHPFYWAGFVLHGGW